MGPVEVLWDGDGVPPAWKGHGAQWKYYGMEILWDGDRVTPPPPCEETDTCKNITSRRTMYAVGKHCFECFPLAVRLILPSSVKKGRTCRLSLLRSRQQHQRRYVVFGTEVAELVTSPSQSYRSEWLAKVTRLTLLTANKPVH